jgi:hypothetical protein
MREIGVHFAPLYTVYHQFFLAQDSTWVAAVSRDRKVAVLSLLEGIEWLVAEWLRELGVSKRERAAAVPQLRAVRLEDNIADYIETLQAMRTSQASSCEQRFRELEREVRTILMSK